MRGLHGLSAALLVFLVRVPDAWAICDCADSHGGWPSGRKGIPRTIRPIILDARPDGEYGLLDFGRVPDPPDPLSSTLLPMEAAENWEPRGPLENRPDRDDLVRGKLRALRTKDPRLLEFVPEQPLPAHHRFALVGPSRWRIIAVFETSDGMQEESPPLERLDLERIVPPDESPCGAGWNVVLREFPARPQPRLLEVFPATGSLDVPPLTLLMSFQGSTLAGRWACSPWGLRLERTRLQYRVRERRLDGTLGAPLPVTINLPKEAIEPPPPRPR